MALESGTYIDSLNASNPVATDGLAQADDHLRLIKSTVKATFPNVAGAITSTQTELNKLDGATASTTELNYVTGVTSSIQGQFNNVSTALSGKQATITGAATTIDDTNLTASRALLSDSSGKVAVSAVTSTELGYLDGVTSNVQTQINNIAGYPQVITVLTSGTSYSIPSGAQAVLVRAAGAGGGGGRRSANNSGAAGGTGGDTTVTNSTLSISITAKGGGGGSNDGSANNPFSTGDSGGDVITGGGAIGGAQDGNYDITGTDGRNGNMVVKYVTGSNVGGQTLTFALGAGGANAGDNSQDGAGGYLEIWVW